MACALLPALMSWQGYVVRSGSMEPHIETGDIVLTSALPKESPAPMGRVVAIKNGASSTANKHGTILMHRIVSANDDDTFVTAGDANRDVDSTHITRDQIAGQGRLLVPWIGLPSLWVDTGQLLKFTSWALLTLLALTVVAMSSKRSRRSSDDRSPANPQHAAQPIHPALVPSLAVAAALVGCGFIVSSIAVPPAEAAFSARTTNAGNSWSVAVNNSKARSHFAVWDNPGVEGWYQRNSVTAYISATADPGARVRSISYRLNGGALRVVNATSAVFPVDQQGINTITYYATDTAGHAENAHQVEVNLDNRPPTLAVTSQTGPMTHAQWKATCTNNDIAGGVCGSVNDGNGIGLGSVTYKLSRSDGFCFNGSTWSRTACNTNPKAIVKGTNWYLSVPDSALSRQRGYYTITMFAADKLGNSVNLTKNFDVG